MNKVAHRITGTNWGIAANLMAPEGTVSEVENFEHLDGKNSLEVLKKTPVRITVVIWYPLLMRALRAPRQLLNSASCVVHLRHLRALAAPVALDGLLRRFSDVALARRRRGGGLRRLHAAVADVVHQRVA